MSGRRRRSESLWDRKEETALPTEMSGKIPLQGKELHPSFHGDDSPKWSNSEVNDALMPGDFSGLPSREPMQGNENMPMDNNNSRDGHRMKTDPAFDEWENQYSSHRSYDSCGLPYRGKEKGVAGAGIMSRDRDRSRSGSRSPNRSRGRDRDRGGMKGMARSRSRSRGRDRDRDRGRARESARARSRSPFSDERRESYEYADMRNDSRVSSRLCKDFAAGNCRRGSQCRFFHQEIVDSRGGGNRLDNDLVEKWGSRQEYSGGSRYGDDRNSADHLRNRGSDGYRKDTGRNEDAARGTDKDEYICKDFVEGRCRRGASCRFPHHVASGDGYHRGNKNEYDDEDRGRQPNRNSRTPCKFFTVGKCSREDCKFSHDALKSGSYEGRSHENIQGRNSGNNDRPQHDLQTPDDMSASGLSDFAKTNSNFDNKNKSWSGPSWNDVEVGGFDEMSHDNVLGHTSGDRTWDAPRWNESEKSAYVLSQLASVISNEVTGVGIEESQLIRDSSQSHTLDGRLQHIIPKASGSQLTNATTGMMPEVPGISCSQQHQRQGDDNVTMVIDNSNAHNMVSGEANQQIHSYGEDCIQSIHEHSSHMFPLSSLNGPTSQLNGSVQGVFLHLDLQKQMEIQNEQGGKPPETLKNDIPQVMHDLNATVASTEQAPQATSLPVSLPQISQKLNLANALELLYTLPTSASPVTPVDSVVVQQNLDPKSKEQHDSARDMVARESIKTSLLMGILSNSLEQDNPKSVEQLSSVSTGDPNSSKFRAAGITDAKQEPEAKLEGNENRMAENPTREQENTKPGKSEAQGRVEEGGISNDEKAMRQFKVALVEFVKEILKPTWKEGKMSREVYKTIVKKVVDKVTGTIQGIQIPRTQEKIDQYLAFSKSKITKLVEAYVGRFLKA